MLTRAELGTVAPGNKNGERVFLSVLHIIYIYGLAEPVLLLVPPVVHTGVIGQGHTVVETVLAELGMCLSRARDLLYR